MKNGGKKSGNYGLSASSCPVGKFDVLGRNAHGQDFNTWPITEKASDSDYAREIVYNANRLLARADIVNPVTEDVPNIVAFVHKTDFSKSHKRHLLNALEKFSEFNGVNDKDGKFWHFKKPHPSRKLPKYLTQDELRTLVKAARDYRELAMLSVFCTGGLRLAELCGLNMEDVEFERKEFRVRHAKFDKEGEVPMGAECEDILRQFIDAFHGPRAGPRTPLFKNIRGNWLSHHACGDIIRKCGARGGISKNVTPHVLRHSFATAMVGNGCDIFHLSRMPGHNDIATTQIYLHVVNEKMREQYDKGVPRLA